MWSHGRSSRRGSSRVSVFASLVISPSMLFMVSTVSLAVEIEPPVGEEVAIGAPLIGGAMAVRQATENPDPRALATGDFDEDGVADLAVGLASPSGGLLVLYRGDVDALYRNSLKAKQRRALGMATESPFLSPARVWATPEIPEFIASGDFDADGHLDLVSASHGSNHLYLHLGDGTGGLRFARPISLPGALTAFESGEINRRDGLADLAVGLRTDDGPKLLVYESPRGALAAPPEIVALEAEAGDLALGELDGIFGIDLAIAAGGRVFIVSGRDRQRSPGDARSAVVDELGMPFAVVAIAVADLAYEEPSRSELAVLSDDGMIHMVNRDEHGSGDAKRRVDGGAEDGWYAVGDGDWQLSREIGRLDRAPTEKRRIEIIPVRLSGAPVDDLVVVGSGDDDLRIAVAARRAKTITARPRSTMAPPHVFPAIGSSHQPLQPVRKIRRDTGEASRAASSAIPFSLITAVAPSSAPRAVLPMRMNGDALDDLVLVTAGQLEPSVIFAKAGETVVVDSTTDVADGATSSISDLTASPGADGVICLREAITAANNTIGADTISFDIPIDTDPGCNAGSGVCTIQPGGTGLPTITQPVTIDGTTQPSFQTTPVIEIDGSMATVDATGLAITAGSSTVRGLVINRFSGNSDIVMWIAGGNVVEGNFLGVDAGGTFNQGTTNSVHVFAIINNTIGGTTAAARNLISGNTNPGVALNGGASFNQVTGNFFGTDMTGTVALGNSGNDVVTLDSPNNTIGGTTPGAGNVSAGGLDPTTASVGLGFPASVGNLVQGNYIGTDVTGTVDLGGASIGAYVGEGLNNTIGGTSPLAGNLISGGDTSGVGIAVGSGNLVQGNLIGTQIDGVTPLPNASHGVLIYSGAANNTVGGRTAGEGNTIAFNGASGVDLRGDAGTGNAIAGNSIFMNMDLGINLCADFNDVDLVCNDATAVLPNDLNDPDVGANELQNFPVLTSDMSGRTISGSLDSIASSDFTLDFYASPVCDPSGYGEGQRFLGSFAVTTDSGGGVSFSPTLPHAAPADWFVVATATDAAGNTSEFSQCFEILEDPIFADGFESANTSVWSLTVP